MGRAGHEHDEMPLDGPGGATPRVTFPVDPDVLGPEVLSPGMLFDPERVPHELWDVAGALSTEIDPQDKEQWTKEKQELMKLAYGASKRTGEILSLKEAPINYGQYGFIHGSDLWQERQDWAEETGLPIPYGAVDDLVWTRALKRTFQACHEEFLAGSRTLFFYGDQGTAKNAMARALAEIWEMPIAENFSYGEGSSFIDDIGGSGIKPFTDKNGNTVSVSGVDVGPIPYYMQGPAVIVLNEIVEGTVAPALPMAHDAMGSNFGVQEKRANKYEYEMEPDLDDNGQEQYETGKNGQPTLDDDGKKVVKMKMKLGADGQPIQVFDEDGNPKLIMDPKTGRPKVFRESLRAWRINSPHGNVTVYTHPDSVIIGTWNPEREGRMLPNATMRRGLAIPFQTDADPDTMKHVYRQMAEKVLKHHPFYARLSGKYTADDFKPIAIIAKEVLNLHREKPHIVPVKPSAQHFARLAVHLVSQSITTASNEQVANREKAIVDAAMLTSLQGLFNPNLPIIDEEGSENSIHHYVSQVIGQDVRDELHAWIHKMREDYAGQPAQAAAAPKKTARRRTPNNDDATSAS